MVIDEKVTPSQISAQLDIVDITTLETLDDLGKRRDKDLLGQLFEIFVQQGPEKVAAMRQALDSSAADQFASFAHTLKGSYQSLGLPRLAKLCTELEMRGKASQLEGLDAWLDHFEIEFDTTRNVLKNFVEGRSGRG